ncbi:MAG: hypothetical protein AAFX53_01390 [Bacteroidota bacterium]
MELKTPIEQFRINDPGYHPFLIRDHWQVAQLNYMEEQDMDNIHKLDVHHYTDEVFVLLKGKVVLIGAHIQNGDPVFTVELMRPNITYNIPKGTWHNIAMTQGSEVLIVEKANTHIADFEFLFLSSERQNELRTKVKQQLNIES